MEKIDLGDIYSQLSSELEEMVSRDQMMREKARMGEPWSKEVDEANTNRLKEIVEEYGLPTISKVGLKSAKDAWLLVQHADHDPEFQEQCLVLMKEAGEDFPMDLVAYLEDRVRVNTNRPQIYGTQFFTDKSGTFGPRDIEDESNLDEKRSSVGLGSFDEYRTRMEEINKHWIETHPKQ